MAARVPPPRHKTAAARVGVSAKLHPQRRWGTLSNEVVIAELPVLAPCDDAVLEMFRSHPSQAASFRDVANGMDNVVANSIKEPSSSPVNGPRHEFADLVV